MNIAAADLLHAFQQMDDSEKRQIMQVLDTPQKKTPRQIPSGLVVCESQPSHLTQTSGNNSNDHVEATLGGGLEEVLTELSDQMTEYNALSEQISKLNSQLTDVRNQKKQVAKDIMEIMPDDIVEMDDYILTRENQRRRAALSEKLVKSVLSDALGDGADPVLEALEQHRQDNAKEELTLSVKANTKKKRKRT